MTGPRRGTAQRLGLRAPGRVVVQFHSGGVRGEFARRFLDLVRSGVICLRPEDLS